MILEELECAVGKLIGGIAPDGHPQVLIGWGPDQKRRDRDAPNLTRLELPFVHVLGQSWVEDDETGSGLGNAALLIIFESCAERQGAEWHRKTDERLCRALYGINGEALGKHGIQAFAPVWERERALGDAEESLQTTYRMDVRVVDPLLCR